jgi:hypothetical protein
LYKRRVLQSIRLIKTENFVSMSDIKVEVLDDLWWFYNGVNCLTGKFHWQHMAPKRMSEIFRLMAVSEDVSHRVRELCLVWLRQNETTTD